MSRKQALWVWLYQGAARCNVSSVAGEELASVPARLGTAPWKANVLQTPDFMASSSTESEVTSATGAPVRGTVTAGTSGGMHMWGCVVCLMLCPIHVAGAARPESCAVTISLNIYIAGLPITKWPHQSGAPVGAAPPTRSQLRLQRRTQTPVQNSHNGCHQPTLDP